MLLRPDSQTCRVSFLCPCTHQHVAEVSFGLVASVGQVAGDGPDADRSVLELVPGVVVSRPSVVSYMRDLQRYRDSAHATIERLRAGLRMHIDSEFPLEDAAGAHRRLESRNSAGSILLRPQARKPS